jgi:hypothetical protein
LESSGKIARASPAAASDLPISRINTIWFPKKEKGGPLWRVKNLAPPMRTSFPHAERRPGGVPRQGSGEGGVGLALDLLCPRMSSRAQLVQPETRTPEEGRQPQESPGWGGPSPAGLPVVRTCCKGRDNGESAGRRAEERRLRGVGGAQGRGKRREGPQGEARAPRYSAWAPRFPAGSCKPRAAAAPALPPSFLSPTGDVNLLSQSKI